MQSFFLLIFILSQSKPSISLIVSDEEEKIFNNSFKANKPRGGFKIKSLSGQQSCLEVLRYSPNVSWRGVYSDNHYNEYICS